LLVEESSIQDPPIGNIVVDHAPVTYKIVDEGTKRRKICLLDSIGFSYNIHSKRSYATYWQCTVRPKGNPCKASVIEKNGAYIPDRKISPQPSGRSRCFYCSTGDGNCKDEGIGRQISASFSRVGVKRGNGTERTGGTGMAEPEKRKRNRGYNAEKRVKRGKEGKTWKRG
jgi:hypothetical protein